MKILPVGFAKIYYSKIYDIHNNHGTQSNEQKIKEYKDILDRVMDNLVDKNGQVINGYDFIHFERRSDKNPNGPVSAILYSCIQLVEAVGKAP